jgi:hypothetical protein
LILFFAGRLLAPAIFKTHAHHPGAEGTPQTSPGGRNCSASNPSVQNTTPLTPLRPV